MGNSLQVVENQDILNMTMRQYSLNSTSKIICSSFLSMDNKILVGIAIATAIYIAIAVAIARRLSGRTMSQSVYLTDY